MGKTLLIVRVVRELHDSGSLPTGEGHGMYTDQVLVIIWLYTFKHPPRSTVEFPIGVAGGGIYSYWSFLIKMYSCFGIPPT